MAMLLLKSFSKAPDACVLPSDDVILFSWTYIAAGDRLLPPPLFSVFEELSFGCCNYCIMYA